MEGFRSIDCEGGNISIKRIEFYVESEYEVEQYDDSGKKHDIRSAADTKERGDIIGEARSEYYQEHDGPYGRPEKEFPVSDNSVAKTENRS